MHEPLPSLRWLFALRQFPMFSNVDLAELGLLVDNVSERTFAPGAAVARAATRLPALQLVLEGRIEVRSGTTVESWGPRDVFGLMEVLAVRPILAPAIATVETRTLELRATDTYEILEDNFGVLHAVIRALAARLAVIDVPRATARATSPRQLTLVERVMVLRQQLVFANGRVQPLAALAQGCNEVVWPAGTRIASSGQVADSLTILLDGSVRASRGNRRPHVLGPGDSTGALEALASLRHLADVEATTAVTALHCPLAAIVDVLEDHADLGLCMVGNFARALLDTRHLEREMRVDLS
jgi:CRP-like cAMP-binding protein